MDFEQLTAEKVFERWVEYVNKGSVLDILSLYGTESVLLPTFLCQIVDTKEGLRGYFQALAERPRLKVEVVTTRFQEIPRAEKCFVVCGLYEFSWEVDGGRQVFPSRFTFVMDLSQEAPIMHHHSSPLPGQ